MFNRLPLFALTLALPLAACGNHVPNEERLAKMVAWKVDDALDEVDATPEQRAKLEPLAQKLVTDAKPVMAQGQETRAALVAEWKKPTPDAVKVHALVDQQLDSVRGLAHGLADALLEVHRTFTPAQRDEVSKRLDKHVARARR